MSREQPEHQQDTGLEPIVLELTRFQAGEVEHGLDIDAADHPDDPVWGEVNMAGRRSRNRFRLVIRGTQQARDRALYRITSARDILLDNAGDSMATAHERRSCTMRGNSMNSVAVRLVEAAGGPSGFTESVFVWMKR